MEEIRKPMGREEWLTAEQVAVILNVTPAWVLAHANGNRKPMLPSVKLGKHRRFRRSAVEAFMRQLEHDSNVNASKMAV